MFMVDVFCMTLILSGVMVISAFNSVHSVLWLIVAFTSAIIIFIILEADFIALIFLIVYVGAIAILFLFVIMMLNFTDWNYLLDLSNYMFSGGLIGMVLFFEVFLIFRWGLLGLPGGTPYFRWYLGASSSNLKVLGEVVYFDYAYYFLLASFILLVAMVGAISLTLERRSVMKRQEALIQIGRGSSPAPVVK